MKVCIPEYFASTDVTQTKDQIERTRTDVVTVVHIVPEASPTPPMTTLHTSSTRRHQRNGSAMRPLRCTALNQWTPNQQENFTVKRASAVCW
jgi:hypothetical protein